MKNRFKLISLTLIPFLLAGCWDRVEIEERGFVVGIAVDKAEDEKKQKMLYEATYQFVIPAGIGGIAAGGTEDKAYSNVSQKGDNMFEIGRDMSDKVARTPYYEHMQLLILSEELVKVQGQLSKVLDFFLRDHEMRRGKKILIAQGNKAKDILNFKPEVDELPSIYLDSIAENNYKTAILLEPARLGDIHENLLEENNFIIPAVKKVNDHIEIYGAAVFKGKTNSLVDIIEEQDVSSLNFITSEVKGGAIKTEYKNELVVFEILKAKSKIDANIKSEKDIEFTISVAAEGNIVQAHKPIDFMNEQEINKIEIALEEALKSRMEKTIDKFQNELKIDLLGLNRVLEQRKYDTWKKIKENWDRGEETFSTSQIHVDTDINIRMPGSSGTSK